MDWLTKLAEDLPHDDDPEIVALIKEVYQDDQRMGLIKPLEEVADEVSSWIRQNTGGDADPQYVMDMLKRHYG
jgi:hypothetical protein